jgi:hypothetical protein
MSKGAPPSDAMQQMVALQQLNVRIVEARKLGDDEEVSRLKAQAQALMDGLSGGGSSNRKARSSRAVSQPMRQEQKAPELAPVTEEPADTGSGDLDERPAIPAMSHQDARSALQVMAELRVVNGEIAEARRKGDDKRVKILQERAENLMKMGLKLG